MRPRTLRTYALISFFGLFGVATFPLPVAWAVDRAEAPITQIHALTVKTVNEGAIYRGRRPTESEMHGLAQMGIKTILNLEISPDAVAKEIVVAKSLGIQHIHLPLPAFSMPEEDKVRTALDVLADPKYYPIFVHCWHGEDRTGLVVGLHRVQHDHWAVEDAYREMLDNNFHRILLRLKAFFFKAVSQPEFIHLSPGA